MSMIDRYRKKGGFVQLLNLIETTGKDKQEKFLKIIADESPAWEAEVRKKMLSLDKVLAWPTENLSEIFPRIQSIQLAMIIGGLPPDKAELCMKTMAFKEKRQIEDILKEKNPSPGETSAGVMKLFAEIRKMESEGSLKFDKFAPDLTVPDNVEDLLGKGGGSHTMPAGKSVDTTVANMAPPPAGTPANVVEELTGLRRKLVQLTQENQKLQHDNTQMKEKLEQIKKIA